MEKIELDLLVITALQKELTAVLNLKEGGRNKWTQKQTPQQHIYYTTNIRLKNGKDLSIGAIAQSQMGPTTAATVASNILHIITPKMICMVGICAGRRKKGIEFGDVIVANQAFFYDIGKKKNGELQHEIQSHNVHPYLQQWLQDFTEHNQNWVASIKDPKPLSPRYQKEWILFQLHSDPGWKPSPKDKENCPDWTTVISLLEKDQMIKIETGINITEKGSTYLANLLYRKLQTSPNRDRETPKAWYGSFATGNSVVEDKDIFDDLADKFDRNVLALEMEAAPFLKACYNQDQSLAAFVIKGVCDYADDEKNDSCQPYAAKAAACYMLHFVEDALPKLSKPNSSPAPKPEKRVWQINREITEYFTGREEIINQLQAGFQSHTARPFAQAIVGTGGLGKTQTSLVYAKRFKDQYKHGFFINAASTSDIITSYFEIAKELGLFAEGDEDVKRVVNNWFEENSDWFLLIDNVDEPELMKGFLPKDYRGHILITSRGEYLEALGIGKIRIHQLQLLESQQAKEFFLKSCQRKDLSEDEQKAVEELLKEFGYFTLAINQAASYVATRKTNIRTYLNTFRNKKIAIFKKDQTLTEKESIATIWELNLQEIEKDEAAKQLLYSISLLAPDDIAFEFFIFGAKQLSPEIAQSLEGVEEDETLLNELFYPLSRYSLIQINPANRTCSMHRLVQEVVKDKLSVDQTKEILKFLTEALIQAFPEEKHSDTQICNQLLPHIREILDFTQNKQIIFERQGVLFNKAASYCDLRGRYSEAEPLYLQALEIRKTVLGLNHPYTARSLNNLAELYRSQGRYEQAEPLYLQALSIFEQVLGSEHPNTQTVRNNYKLLLSKVSDG
ncbi:MAG: tetratricopeptide repeat protein [Blastocatellia bacterium]|nr:tetratricopeptide repeat protein [Blastocatellia bacterium]